MKVIIAGSRDITDYDLVVKSICQFVKYNGPITEVICGEAPGVDSLGKKWAIDNNIPVKSFPANWDLYGKKAGPIRNKEMAKYAAESNGGCLAIQQNDSKGTQSMITLANQYNLKTLVVSA